MPRPLPPILSMVAVVAGLSLAGLPAHAGQTDVIRPLGRTAPTGTPSRLLGRPLMRLLRPILTTLLVAGVFATQCGETKVGGVDYLEPLRMAGLVTYAPGVSASLAKLSADVGTIDPMHVPARGFGEGNDAARMIAFVEEAEAGRGMAVLLFHGIGGDHLAVTDAQHRAFIAWLKAHRHELWVTTLQQALDWAKGQATAT